MINLPFNNYFRYLFTPYLALCTNPTILLPLDPSLRRAHVIACFPELSSLP